MLDAAAAERVLDPVFLLLAGEVRLGDEVFAVGDAQPVALSLEGHAVFREVADDAGRRSPAESSCCGGRLSSRCGSAV